jgi:hypothetical protein
VEWVFDRLINAYNQERPHQRCQVYWPGCAPDDDLCRGFGFGRQPQMSSSHEPGSGTAPMLSRYRAGRFGYTTSYSAFLYLGPQELRLSERVSANVAVGVDYRMEIMRREAAQGFSGGRSSWCTQARRPANHEWRRAPYFRHTENDRRSSDPQGNGAKLPGRQEPRQCSLVGWSEWSKLASTPFYRDA